MVVDGVPESLAPSKRHCSRSRVISGADQTWRRGHWLILPAHYTEHCGEFQISTRLQIFAPTDLSEARQAEDPSTVLSPVMIHSDLTFGGHVRT
jgi:hypothetical protein